jgi:hypothetical protein
MYFQLLVTITTTSGKNYLRTNLQNLKNKF